MSNLVKYVSKRFGLINNGQMCHFNSLVQSLISSPIANKTILNSDNIKKTRTGRLLFEFVKKSIFLTPSHVQDLYLSLVCNTKGSYGCGQESVSEGLVLLLDVISDNNNDCDINQLFQLRYDIIIKCLDCSFRSESTDSSVHVNLFSDYEETPEGFAKVIELQVTRLDGFKCPNGHYNTAKIQKLNYAPQVLICLFNQYYDRKKHYFPQKFKFKSGIAKPLLYKQVAQVEHYGSLHSGHYSCRGLRYDGIYNFDDENVSPCVFEPTPDTYIVIYNQI